MKIPAFVELLTRRLKEDLEKAGISASVEVESVPATRLFRFMVSATKFKKLMHSERQSLVWRIAEKALTPEEQLLVSMILTLVPESPARPKAPRKTAKAAASNAL